MSDSVQFLFKEEERAGGVIHMMGVSELPWTAVRSDNGKWYVVLHGELVNAPSATLRVLLDTIKNSLVSLPKAA